MAASDYGVIAKKNGKIINTDIFTPMYNTLGFFDDLASLKYFICLGDEHFYVGIYKFAIDIYKNNERIGRVYDLYYYTISSQGDNYSDSGRILAQYKYKCKIEINGVTLEIKRLFCDDKYYLKFRYKEDLYEVVYGYGVASKIENWYGLTPKVKKLFNNFINS